MYTYYLDTPHGVRRIELPWDGAGALSHTGEALAALSARYPGLARADVRVLYAHDCGLIATPQHPFPHSED